MNNILSWISAILALVGAALFGLFKREKSKRIKAEEEAAEKAKEIVIKEAEAESVSAARYEEKATAVKLEEIETETKEKIEETKATAPADQTQLYNEKVRGWRKVTR